VQRIKETNKLTEENCTIIANLHALSKSDKGATLPPKEAELLAENLRVLMPFPIGQEEMEKMTSLFNTLSNATGPIELKNHQTPIKIVYNAFERVYAVNTAPQELVLEYGKMGGTRFFRHLIPSQPTHHTIKKVMTWEKEAKAELRSKAPVDKQAETIKQIDLLKKNASRRLIGNFIFSLCKINPIHNNSNTIIQLIEASNPEAAAKAGINSDRLFQQALENKINGAKISGLRKTAARFALQFAAPLIAYSIQGFIKNITALVNQWIAIPTTARLNTLYIGLIKPIDYYLATFLKIYADLRNRTPSSMGFLFGYFSKPNEADTKNLEADIALAVKTFQRNPKRKIYLPSLIHRLTERIISFVPTFHWTDKAVQQCQEKMEHVKKSSLWYLWWSGSSFFSILGYLISPVQSIINRSIKISLSKLLKRALNGLLSKDSTNNLTSYHLKKILVKHLQQINGEGSQAQEKKFIDMKLMMSVPPEVSSGIFKTINNFRQILFQQILSSDHMVKFLKGDQTASYLVNLLEQVPPQIIKPLIYTQILPILQDTFEQNRMEDFWLDCLKKINEALLQPPSSQEITDSDKYIVDGQLRQELDTFLSQRWPEIKSELLKPEESQAKLMNSYLQGCKNNVTELVSKLKEQLEQPNLNNNELDSIWSTFEKEEIVREKKIQEVVNEEAILEIQSFGTPFVEQSKPLKSALQKLLKINGEKNTLKGELESVNAFISVLEQVVTDKMPQKPAIEALRQKLNYFELPHELKPLQSDLARFIANFKRLTSAPSAATLNQLKSYSTELLSRIKKQKTETLDQTQATQAHEINRYCKEIKKQLEKFNTWVQGSVFKKIDVAPNKTVETIIQLIDNPTVNNSVNLFFGELTSQALEFINQKHHSPFFIQYLLKALLKLPSLPMTQA
jgi:hypothetical protein